RAKPRDGGGHEQKGSKSHDLNTHKWLKTSKIRASRSVSRRLQVLSPVPIKSLCFQHLHRPNSGTVYALPSIEEGGLRVRDQSSYRDSPGRPTRTCHHPALRAPPGSAANEAHARCRLDPVESRGRRDAPARAVAVLRTTYTPKNPRSPRHIAERTRHRSARGTPLHRWAVRGAVRHHRRRAPAPGADGGG